MRAIIFLSFLLSFFGYAGQDVVAAVPGGLARIESQHIATKQGDLSQHDLSTTFVEDDFDSLEDPVNEKAKETVKSLIAKSIFAEIAPTHSLCISNQRVKSAPTFAHPHHTSQPIYIVHRVLRI